MHSEVDRVNPNPTDHDPPAPWLTEDDRVLWESLISIVISLPVVLDRELQQTEGMTHFEYSVLARLLQADGRRRRLSDLAQSTGSTLPRLSKAITRCERDGWVVRRPDPTDGRATYAELTEAGYAQLLAAAPAHLEQVRRLVLDPLSAKSRRVVAGSLAQIAEAIRGEL